MVSLLAALTIASALFTGMHRTAAAQKSPQTEASPAERDLSGVWFTRGNVRKQFLFEGVAPLLPAAAEHRKIAAQQLSPGLLCFPPGVPKIWTEPYPFEIISLPGRVLIYYEYEHLVRQIHTDGREHSKTLVLTFMGDSIGRWDGDALVIDTIGLNDRTFIDNSRLPHSEALRVTERIRRVSHDELHVEITIDDPKTFEKPWSAQRIYDLKPGWEISEQVCEENNPYIAAPGSAPAPDK